MFQTFKDMQGGAALATGLFDLYKTEGGNLEYGFMGDSTIRMSADNITDIGKWNDLGGRLTKTQVGMGMIGGAGGLVSSAVFGYQVDGLKGAANAVASDVAIHGALMQHHYLPKAAGQKGAGMVAPGLINGWGQKVSKFSKLRNSAGYLFKGAGGGIGGLIGSSIGGTIGGAVGGSYGSFAGSVGGTVAGSYAGVAVAAAFATPVGAVAGLGLGTMALGTTAVVGGSLAAGYGAYQTLKNGYYHRQRQKGIHTSGSLAAFNTNGAQTMRQRAVQAISKSHLNARSALGQEANLMSMPSRNYHSRYRRFY